jgi:hypothetical protein
MALSERFGLGQAIILGVQARPVENVTTLTVEGVKILNTNLEDERTGFVDIFLDGNFFELKFTFRDETLSHRTFTGAQKKKTDQTPDEGTRE